MPITKKNAHQYLPLLQAIADGKTLQVQDPVDPKGFYDVNPHGVSFNYPPAYYRIKPEPRRFTLMVPKPNHPNPGLRPQVKKPDILYDPCHWETVEVVEVMDE